MSAIHEERIRYLGLLSAADKLLLKAAVAADCGEEETRCDRALPYAEEALVHIKMAIVARDAMANGGALRRAIQAHDEAKVDSTT